MHYERIARRRDWREPWITWRDGRAPLGFLLVGLFLLHRATLDTPPAGWPVYFVTGVFVIVWLQWVAAVQGACNALWMGAEAPEDELEGIPAADAAGASAPPVTVTAAEVGSLER